MENKEIILKNVTLIDENNNTLQLINYGKIYLLRPLYYIEEQSYDVYVTIRNY